MKVYELMQELATLPSGAEVQVGGSLTLKEFEELNEEAADEFVPCIKPAEDCYIDDHTVKILF